MLVLARPYAWDQIFDNLARRSSAILDLIIIGGGINGTSIARDAAGRGLNLALFEQDDIGQHASSQGAKLFWGDVREAETLRHAAPHIMSPLEICRPDAKFRAKTGFFAAGPAGAKRIPLARHPAGQVLKPGQDSVLGYPATQVDDSRLAVLNAMDAAASGAKFLVRTKFISAQAENGMWYAQTGAGMFSARAIINAAGRWAPEIQKTTLGQAPPAGARLVKSAHIIARKLYPENQAFELPAPDGRGIFVLPYERDYTLIGAVGFPFEGDPAEVAVTEDETEYLCAGVNQALRSGVRPDDVLWTFSTACARFGGDDGLVLNNAPGTPPLLAVDGGNLASYRRRAEQAVTILLRALGRGAAPGWTAKAKLPGAEMADFTHFERIFSACHSHLGPQTTQRLARAYGSRAEMFAGQDMGQDFGAGLTAAEVDYLVKHEWARTPEDILWRRTKLGLHAPDGAEARLAAYLRRS